MILDRKNDYETEELVEHKNLNKYQETFAKAHEYINLRMRVEKITDKLMKNLLKAETKKKIFEIEGIIND